VTTQASSKHKRWRFTRTGPVIVRGEYLESTTIGSMVFVRTTLGMYVTHQDWIPGLDPISAARVRELYAIGDHSLMELARMFDVSDTMVHACLSGKGAWKGLPKIKRPVIRCPRFEYNDQTQRSST